jgi:DNA-binding beta-propeller fold protein YncE
LFFLAGSIFTFGQTPASQQSASLAYVLDPGRQSITAIDLLSGKTTATASINGSSDIGLDRMELTPDGSRLAMLIDSASKSALTLKSTVTIIDTNTMKPFQPIDIGHRLSNYFITPDSKVLFTVSSGFNSSQTVNVIPSEIVSVNLSSGQVIERIPIPRQVTGSLISKDGKTAILYFARQKLPYHHFTKAEIQFISLEKQAAAETISFDGDLEMPFLSPSGEFIYLIEKGNPSHNPGKNINGKVHVISVKDGKVEAVLDAGSNPRIALPDDGAGQALILSNGPPVPLRNQIVDAEIRVLRGASIESILKVGNEPKYLSFSPDRKRLYVTSTFNENEYVGLPSSKNTENDSTSRIQNESLYSNFDLLTAIDYTSLKVLGQIPLDGAVSGAAVTPDGTRGFTLDPKSSKMLTLDLQALKPGAVISTGKSGIKAKHFILSSDEGSASMFFPMTSNAFPTTDSLWYSSANTSIFVRRDSAFVYVLNHDAQDVTVVNTKDSSVAAKIAVEGRRLQPLEGGDILAVLGDSSIHRIDTSTQKALPEINLKSKLISFSLSPDGRTAVALTQGGVLLLNGRTGELQNRMDDFREPQMILFAPSAQRADHSGQSSLPTAPNN